MKKADEMRKPGIIQYIYPSKMFRCIHVRICLERSSNVGYSHTRMFPLFALTDFVLKLKLKKNNSLDIKAMTPVGNQLY